MIKTTTMITRTKIMKTRMTNERVWPLGIVTVMIVFVAVMLGVVTVAFQHRPQLVTEHYYAEGSNLREWKEHKEASEATGWQVQVKPMAPDLSVTPLVELAVTDLTGSAVDSLTGNVTFYRPADKSLDIELTALQTIGGGRYLAKLPRRLETGSWQAVTHLERGAQKMDTRVSFFVER